jgi:hypothetical protein
LLHAPEARFNYPGAVVSKRHIFSGERVIIHNDHEFAIEFLCRLEFRSIERGAAQMIRGEITAAPARPDFCPC